MLETIAKSVGVGAAVGSVVIGGGSLVVTFGSAAVWSAVYSVPFWGTATAVTTTLVVVAVPWMLVCGGIIGACIALSGAVAYFAADKVLA